jgi:toxin ParE1/3/4
MQLKAKKQILMSAPKYQLIITQLAKQDFRDVISYTLQIWGKQQSQNYAQKINTALNAICENPDIGRIKHRYLVCKAGRHNIFYKIKEREIWVIRILHERMDATRHLA